MNAPENSRRFAGLTSLARAGEALVAPIFKKRGFVQARILTDWRHIVGETLAEVTAPQALHFPKSAHTGGTLTLHTHGAFALELQHMTPLVLERINTYFGYKAVDRLKIVQAPIARPLQKPNGAKPPSLPLPPPTGDALTDALAAMHVAIAHKNP